MFLAALTLSTALGYVVAALTGAGAALAWVNSRQGKLARTLADAERLVADLQSDRARLAADALILATDAAALESPDGK